MQRSSPSLVSNFPYLPLLSARVVIPADSSSLSAPLARCPLGSSHALSVVGEQRVKKVLVSGSRLSGEVQANLLPSPGLLDMFSPSIQEVVMPILVRSRCLLDAHSARPLSRRFGKEIPFPQNRRDMPPSNSPTVNAKTGFPRRFNLR